MSVTLLDILFIHYPIMSLFHSSLFYSVSKEADPDNYTHGLPKELNSVSRHYEDINEQKGTKVKGLPSPPNSTPTSAWIL